MTAALRRAVAWHPPLMVLAGVMAVCAVACVVGLLVDPRTILGAPAWAKPLKFSLSIGLYAATWAWLIAHLPRRRALARRLGTVVAAALLVEQALIVWAVATGTTSHFNVSTPVATAIWTAMAVSITTLYVCTFLTTIAVFFLRLGTPSTTLAVRAGAVIALVGMGLAYLMTSPTAAQLADFRGIAGAHTVGLADGGPGLPVLGWSTVGGDLRIPHFVGMHALQLLPLFAILLGWLGRRWHRLADDRVRTRLVVVATVVYAGVVALVTAQALAGQSIVRPDPFFLLAGSVLAAAAVAATALILFRRPAPLPLPA